MVNDVLNIFDTSGNPQLSFPVDLNTFYGYRAVIVRFTNTFGPSITDPSCYFDVDTQRWFVDTALLVNGAWRPVSWQPDLWVF